MTQKIFITSFPYVYERYFKMFDYFQDKERLLFILPNNWQVKQRGRYVPVPKRDDIRIETTRAYFWHSRYPLIGGLMKCFMPGVGPILKRDAHRGDVLFTATEPNLLSTLWNAYVARRYGVRHVIYTDQNVPYRQRLSGLKLWFVEWLVRKNVVMAERIICSNQKALEILKEYTNLSEKLVLIPQTGVDTALFHPERVEHAGVIFGFAGMLEPRKGIRELAAAFAEVHAKLPDTRLRLVGFGPEKVIGDGITISPFVPNDQLPAFFSSLDVFVCYSLPYRGWEEQLGYSMREAIASGVPVISTRSGSINEIVVDGKSGFLVKPYDHQELVAAMLKLARDGQLRLDMGRAARTYATEHYSYEVIASRLESFFDSLVNRNNPHA